MTTAIHTTREAWLEAGIEVFRPRFAALGYELPQRVHVSVGFSYGARAESKKILGTTWRKEISADEVHHVFISPEIGDPVEAVETLLHELIHVVLNCEDGHRGRFIDIAAALGFEKPWTATPSGIVLATELITIAESLGTYPHGALDLSKAKQLVTLPPAGPGGTIITIKPSSGPGKQSTRQLKVSCMAKDCPCGGYVVRTTAKWLAIGNPRCPAGNEMTPSI